MRRSLPFREGKHRKRENRGGGKREKKLGKTYIKRPGEKTRRSLLLFQLRLVS